MFWGCSPAATVTRVASLRQAEVEPTQLLQPRQSPLAARRPVPTRRFCRLLLNERIFSPKCICLAKSVLSGWGESPNRPAVRCRPPRGLCLPFSAGLYSSKPA